MYMYVLLESEQENFQQLNDAKDMTSHSFITHLELEWGFTDTSNKRNDIEKNCKVQPW